MEERRVVSSGISTATTGSGGGKTPVTAEATGAATSMVSSSKPRTSDESRSSSDVNGRHVSPTSALETSKFGSYNSASSTGAFEDADAESLDARRVHEGSALTRSASRQQIDKLLSESLALFHRDGPLVNPLERTMSSSNMASRLRFVCEAKGFEYGLFWGFDDEKKSLSCDAHVCTKGADSVSLFVNTSHTMFARFSMGFGMPGRIGYTGNYEWHEDIRQLPAWSFQRKRQAEQAGLRTVIGVPLDKGVVEFGTTSIVDHSVTTVQYIQKLCSTQN